MGRIYFVPVWVCDGFHIMCDSGLLRIRAWLKGLRVPAHPLFAQLVPVFEFLVEAVSFPDLILKLPMKGTVLADVYRPRPILKLVSGNVDDEFIDL